MEDLFICFKIFQASNAIKGIKDIDPNVLKMVEKYLDKISKVIKSDPSESSRVINEINDSGFIDAIMAYCNAIKWLDNAAKRLASYDEPITTINNPDILSKLKEELDGDDNM